MRREDGDERAYCVIVKFLFREIVLAELCYSAFLSSNGLSVLVRSTASSTLRDSVASVTTAAESLNGPESWRTRLCRERSCRLASSSSMSSESRRWPRECEASDIIDCMRKLLASGDEEDIGDLCSSVKVARDGDAKVEGEDAAESALFFRFDIRTVFGFNRRDLTRLGGTELASPPSLDTGICTTIFLPANAELVLSVFDEGTRGVLVRGEDVALVFDLTLTMEGFIAATPTALPAYIVDAMLDLARLGATEVAMDCLDLPSIVEIPEYVDPRRSTGWK